jgi:TRAP-type mannitol/chloroaromatic compound transport system substrate-binding protein
MKRRDFLGTSLAGAGLAAGAVTAPFVHAAKTVRWNMVTTWTPDMPITQTGAERFARRVGEMSGGRLQIQVYAAGELVPGLGVFDAVSSGSVECGSGAAYYWAGNDPALQWFSAVPFGLNPQGMNAWLYAGGGNELWDEVYGRYGIVGRSLFNTGVQMGGWFNKEINTMEDFKGLKMRIPGLGGKVVAKAGGTVVLLAGGEIFTSLERGVIDATEWIGPLHDLRMGFHEAAEYYYYPGWHEPGTCLDVIFNKQRFEALPEDLKQILFAAAAESTVWSLAQFEARNGAALEELVTKHGVKLRRFPADVLSRLRELARETVAEEAGKSELTRKVADSFEAFRKQWGPWSDVADRSYFDTIAERYVSAGG